MRRKIFVAAAMLLILLVRLGTANPEGRWTGVDEAVVQKFAQEANRPARDPWIKLEGDLPLFLFLLAGAAGGFVGGYYFRTLFPPSLRKGS
ncbi:MAG TPA: hypothetical protein VLS90_14230 [Thermodesulfobacteriota bacterium]|nr:hypothetical protein [Thermodesulfobacteriota bacterium]